MWIDQRILKIAWHYVLCLHPPPPPETIMPDSKSEIKVVKTVRERDGNKNEKNENEKENRKAKN